jgi:selenide,water dikinase
VHPDRVLTKGDARPGDALVLAKPLGVGIITTVLKAEMAEADHVAAAVEGIKTLNRQAAQFVQKVGVHACTDVTGFALLGHGYEMAERSDARFQLYFEKIPFWDGAKRYAEDNLFPGGSCNNRDAYERWVDFAPNISEEMQLLLFTPETSGGLLVAVPPERLDTLTTLFTEARHPCWVIGEVVEGAGIQVI